MIRARNAVAATIVGVSFVGATLFAQPPQTTTAPPMTSVLAGKKFSPPIKGEANIDIVKSPTKREGTTLVTKTVRGPLARRALAASRTSSSVVTDISVRNSSSN